jgi:hypothetical protein
MYLERNFVEELEWGGVVLKKDNLRCKKNKSPFREKQ